MESSGAQPAPLAEDLLAVLRCPVTRSALRQEGDRLVAASGLMYPIVDGIPILLADHAELPEGVASLDELRPTPTATGDAAD